MLNKIVFAILAFATMPAAAQDANTLSLNQFIAQSLGRSDSVAEQALQNKKDRAVVSERKSAFAPTLSLAAELDSIGGGNSASLNGNQISTAQEQTSVNTRVVMTENIFNGLQDVNKLKSSRFAEDQSRYTLVETRRAQIESALKIFFALLEDQSDISYEQREMQSNEKSLGRTRAKIKIGSARETEAISLESTIATNQIDLSTSQASLAQSQESARRLLKREADGIEVGYSQHHFDPAQMKTILDKMDAKNRADFLASKANTEAQHLTLSATQAVNAPKLDLSTSYTLTDSQQFSQRGQHTVGLVLSIPMPFGLEKNAQVDQARATYEIAQRDEEQKKQDLELDRMQLIRLLHSNVDQIEKLKVAQTLSKKTVDALERDRRSGLSTYTEVLTAFSNYQATIRKYERALLEFDLNCLRAAIWSAQEDEISQLFGGLK